VRINDESWIADGLDADNIESRWKVNSESRWKVNSDHGSPSALNLAHNLYLPG
jgi:hypothetical protein